MSHYLNFIKKANKKHLNKFDYSLFKYVNAKTKSVIVCPLHGAFSQNPDKHLTSVYGCLECSIIGRNNTRNARIASGEITINRPLKYTANEMKIILERRYPILLFDLSNYSGVKTRIAVTCKRHGKFHTYVANLLSKNNTTGCKLCGNELRAKSRTKKYEEVRVQLIAKWKDIYIYPETLATYMSKRSKIPIKCKKHGVFYKSAQKHLSGQGCEECTYERLVKEGKLPGGYCRAIFERSDDLKNRTGYLYYIQIGSVFKIGITTNIKNRIKSIKSKSNSSIILLDSIQLPLYEAYLLEQKILDKYKDFRTSLLWTTEVFTKNIFKDGKIKNN